MTIQIIGYREYYDKESNSIKIKTDFLNKKWRAPSVSHLYANIIEYLAVIPEDQRYNLHYTIASCIEGKGRKFHSQEVIAFDIDGIDMEKLEDYITVVLSTLSLDRDKTGISCSGNGLHFIIGLDEPIEEVEYFEEHKQYYKAVCDKLDAAFKANGLAGHADPVILSKGKTLRLPETENRKPQGNTKAYIIQPNIEPTDFDLTEVSGIPTVDYDEQISPRMLDRLPPPDTNGVLNGCEYLKFCKENQEEISEPQWYAMLSIVGRLEKGRDLCHEYSRQHPSYSQHETDVKITQAIDTSGPRTCENISTLWSGCHTCPNHEQCKSPITLQSLEFIKTQNTGFHSIVIDGNGIKKGKPNYNDLMKYFETQHPFITMAESNITFIWEDNHWRDYAPRKIDAFAEQNFDPTPVNSMCNEFRGKLQRNNIRDPDWFETKGIVNFSNGVLDLKTMELHSSTPDHGFRYVLPFSYDPSAECPRFDRFLEEVTCNDGGLTQVLLEFMGYSLAGIDPAIGQKALVLVGGGSNGKSVFMDLLKYLAGDGNYSTLSMGNEINKLENRYQLDGKLFNISEETPSNAMMDSTVFKAIIAGGEVQARKLYCDSYSMRNNAKIIMACNELPATRDLSHGMFRRLMIAPFLAVFGPECAGYDPHIRDKLYAEASGIFNKAFKALAVFNKNEMFSDSDAVNRQLDSYRKTNDDVLAWWETCIVVQRGSKVSINDLYMNYKLDSESASIKPKNRVWFARDLRVIVNDEDTFIKTRKDGKVQTVLVGYKLAVGDGDF